MGYFIICGFPLYFEPRIPYKWINICKYLLIQLLIFEFCVEFQQNSIKIDIFNKELHILWTILFYEVNNYEPKLCNSTISECFPVNFVITSSLPSDITSRVISYCSTNNNCCTECLAAARQSSTESSACACAAQIVRLG